MFMPFVEKSIAQSRFASQWVCFSCFYGQNGFASQWVCFSCFYGQNGLASVVLLVKMDLFQLFYWSKWTCFSCFIGQNELVSVVLLVKIDLFQLFYWSKWSCFSCFLELLAVDLSSFFKWTGFITCIFATVCLVIFFLVGWCT